MARSAEGSVCLLCVWFLPRMPGRFAVAVGILGPRPSLKSVDATWETCQSVSKGSSMARGFVRVFFGHWVFRSKGGISMRILGRWAIGMAVFILPVTGHAQDFIYRALASFPPETLRVEYSSPAKLRALPNYASLRQRYVGPRLKALEDSFAQLGVQESDIDELVLGWQPGEGSMQLGGFVAGRFDSQTLADRASARGLSPVTVAGLPAYCLGTGPAAACVVVVEGTTAVFGRAELLAKMLQAREGNAPNVMADTQFMKLVGEAQTKAPIWGVAVRGAIVDWFQAWLPAQQNLQMDWASTFQSVEDSVYSVDPGEKVNLDVKLDCTTPEAAGTLRQIIDGLRMFQQMAWQNTHPNVPNPFEAVEVGLTDRSVTMKLTTTYADLESATAIGGR